MPLVVRIPATIENMERGLAMLAHIIELDGDGYLPLFEMLEKELDLRRRVKAAADRGRDLDLTFDV